MATHYQGTEKEAAALNAYIALMRASESLASRLTPSIDAAKLTWSQFGVLEMLHHLGPLAQCDIAKRLLRSGGNVTMVVDNLEKRGLVSRERNAEDRRSVTVTISPEGTKIIKAAFKSHLEALANEFSILSSEELGTLRKICKVLGLQKRE